MTRPSTKGGRILRPKTVGAFFVGAGIGAVLVAPALPDAFGGLLAIFLASGGDVILIGVAALAVLMVFITIAYQFYL